MSIVLRYGIALITVINGILLMSDVEKTLELRGRNLIRLIPSILVGCAIVAVLMYFFDNSGVPTVGRLSIVISLGLYAAFFSKLKPYANVTLISIYYTQNILVRTARGVLQNVYGVELPNTPFSIFMQLLVFALGLIIVGHFIRRFTSQNTRAVSKPFWVSFISLLLANEVCRILYDFFIEQGLITVDQMRRLEGFTYDLVIIALILSVYYLIYTMSTYYRRNEELQLLHIRQSEAMADVARANQMYEEMRVLRHEFKNNILTIRGLAKTKQYDKLEQYLNNYLKTDGTALNYIDCGNKVLNNILNYKYTNLTGKGVTFNYKVRVPEELPFDERDITSLLVNLIDNAAEAGSKTDSPSVDMNIIVEKGYCFITVANPVKDDILSSNPDLHTTKDDKHSHGIGLKVVRSIVEKYDGYVDFEQKDGEFTVSAMLSLG